MHSKMYTTMWIKHISSTNQKYLLSYIFENNFFSSTLLSRLWTCKSIFSSKWKSKDVSDNQYIYKHIVYGSSIRIHWNRFLTDRNDIVYFRISNFAISRSNVTKACFIVDSNEYYTIQMSNNNDINLIISILINDQK